MVMVVMIIIEQRILKLVGRGTTMRWPRGGRIGENLIEPVREVTEVTA